MTDGLPLFEASRLKIARAKAHIATFDAFVSAHLKEHPPKVTHTFEKPDDPSSDLKGVHVDIKRLPPDGAAIVGDVVHNLRAALDLLAVDMVRAKNANTKSVYFPFCESALELDAMIKHRKFDRAGPEAVALLKTLAPHVGGNVPLRGLHDFDIQDKHHTLLPVISMASAGVRVEMRDGAPVILPDTAPPFSVVFPEESVFALQPITPTLQHLGQMVEAIVKDFAALVPEE